MTSPFHTSPQGPSKEACSELTLDPAAPLSACSPSIHSAAATAEPKSQPKSARHQHAYEKILLIENDFAQLREQTYHHTLRSLERELSQLSAGKHPAISSSLMQLEQKREKKNQAARNTRERVIAAVESEYAYRMKQAECFYLWDVCKCRRGMIQNKQGLMSKLKYETRDKVATEGKVDRNVLIRKRRHRIADLTEWKELIDYGGFPASTLYPLKSQEVEEDIELMKIL